MQEQNFVTRGRNVFTASDRGDEIPAIPAGYYTVQDHPMAGLFLKRVDDFTLPEKLYGTALPRAAKILNTFNEREGKTTGVLLSGNKGSGKSLLSKAVCVQGYDAGMPIIILDQPMGGPAFEAFMNSIKQPCIVWIDEFEKKYKNEEEQNTLLSLLDGTGVGQKMYLLTSNSADVSQYLLNRPSRIFYHYSYKKLEEEIMLGYIADHLQNSDYIKHIQTMWALSTDMSFDILQSLVEELNRYPESNFLDVLDAMNINLAGQFMRIFTLKKVECDNDELKIMPGQRAHVHLVHFQDGDAQIGATVELPLEEQIALKDGMKSTEFYFYNYSEEKDLKEKGSYDEDSVSTEFPIKLCFEEGSTFLNSENLRFHRQWSGKNYVFHFSAEKKDSTRSALEKLFS